MSEPKEIWVLESREIESDVWLFEQAYGHEPVARKTAEEDNLADSDVEYRVRRYVPAESETCRCGHLPREHDYLGCMKHGCGCAEPVKEAQHE